MISDCYTDGGLAMSFTRVLTENFTTNPTMSVPPISFVKRIQLWTIRLPAIVVILTSLMPTSSAYATPEGEKMPDPVSPPALVLDLRSPLDGRLLTATEYADLQAEIDRLNEVPPQVSPKIRRLVGLLKFRKFIKRVLPIVPIK